MKKVRHMVKILIVEDDLGMRNSLRTLLEEHGYQVFVIEQFENLFQTWKEKYHEVDLILLDIQIPHSNGELLLKEIRKESSVPIIMVTSRNSELDEVLSMSYGADDYITKPYNPSILLLHIDAVLRRGKQETQTITYQDITLNIGKCQLERKDKIRVLTNYLF